MKQTTPCAGLSTIRRSAMRKKRTYRSLRPCPCGAAGLLRGAVSVRQIAFLVYRHAGEAVVRRIAQDDEDRRSLLHAVGRVVLLLELREGQRVLAAPSAAPSRSGRWSGKRRRACLPVSGALEVRQAAAQVAGGRPRTAPAGSRSRRRALWRPSSDRWRPGRRRPCPRSVCAMRLEHFDQVSPGAAARVEHIHVRVRQAVRDVQFLAQHAIHPLDHVLHDLRRRVPDAKLLAKLRVERFQERLVEILNRVLAASNRRRRMSGAHVRLEEPPSSSRISVRSSSSSPPGLGRLRETTCAGPGREGIAAVSPVEQVVCPLWLFLMPKDPGRKQAVEQGLDECRWKKCSPLSPSKVRPSASSRAVRKSQ